jgi:hypothetical protein
MSNKKSSVKSPQVSLSAISQLVGASPVLPGEPEDVYQQGLVATVQELGATTPLQVYLSEKIFECMWWMRRYENQKRATVIHAMAKALARVRTYDTDDKLLTWVEEVLHANRLDDEFAQLLVDKRFTMQSLTQRSMASCQGELLNLEGLISNKAKTMAGFQASYEVLVNRKVNAERMRLQNSLLQRDLGAIDNEPSGGDGS